MWLARYWVWTNKTKLNREFPSLLIYFSLNVPVARLILDQNLQDRQYGLCLTRTPRSHIEYMKTQLDFLLRDFLFHRDSLRRVISPIFTSSCSSGETSKAWLAINCSNFSFWLSISISECYLFQKARSNFEDAIASLILIIMEFLHDSFERNRVLECEEDHKNDSNMIEFEQAVNDPQNVIFEVEFIRGAPFLQRISIVLFIGSFRIALLFPGVQETRISALSFR